MDAPAITWEQTRAFRLERMHLVEPLGSRSLHRVAKDLGGIHAQVHSGEGHLCFGPSRGRNVAFTRPDQWLDGWTEPPPTDEALAAVLRRYLASHGPASRTEFARWWGFAPPDANGVLKALENDLVQVDREGEKAFILKRDLKVLQAAEEDDLVRMLPMFDAYTLAGLPHEAIVPKAKKDLVYRKGAWVSQVVLRGGRVTAG